MKNKWMTLAVLAALSGCGGVPLPPWDPDKANPPKPATVAPGPAAPNTAAALGPGAARYRCEQGIEASVRITDDTAVVDAGERGRDTLLRDAGGLTPRHSVWSSPRMRAEFGLGPEGREAYLHYPGLTVHCDAL